ncbi:MAG: LysM peptidoglycan-binding domain-containing protein, partial [Patescibacteria group bacterium]
MAFATSIVPDYAEAFWPFSTNADAAVNTFTPDSGTPVLSAATNSDPNPNKGLGDSIQTSGGKALLAYSGPSGTITEVVANDISPDRISVYEVLSGDTLSDIAKMFNVSVNTIIWANNLSSVKDIHEHDILIILPVSGIERVVVKGDTLKSLAKKYGADVNEIAQFNGLDPAKALVVGSTIIIPGGEISAPKSSPIIREAYLSGGSVQTGYYGNPVPGGILTQGLHGLNAVDIGAARGTPIHAATNGTVIIVRNNGAWNGGYGNYVVITHDNGTQTLYSHMRSSIVSVGQEVSNGQTIGYVG